MIVFFMIVSINLMFYYAWGFPETYPNFTKKHTLKQKAMANFRTKMLPVKGINFI